jgi:hypothetical protein
MLTLCSIMAAVGTMYFFRWLVSNGSSAPFAFAWETTFVVSTMIVSWVFGIVEPQNPWRWPFLMAYVHYFSGFFIMKNWGQIPPFEVMYVTVLALPAVAAGYLGARLGTRHRDIKDAQGAARSK